MFVSSLYGLVLGVLILLINQWRFLLSGEIDFIVVVMTLVTPAVSIPFLFLVFRDQVVIEEKEDSRLPELDADAVVENIDKLEILSRQVYETAERVNSASHERLALIEESDNQIIQAYERASQINEATEQSHRSVSDVDAEFTQLAEQTQSLLSEVAEAV